MAALLSTAQFLDLLRKSQLVDEKRLAAFLDALPGGPPDKPRPLAEALFRSGYLTQFQAGQLLQGKWRGFLIANKKYKLLELLGVGGMGKVYLCEHVRMKRLVAVKVLPKDKLDDPSTLERFEREALAAAALDHPHIVRAHDLDHEAAMGVHFLVMEFVDGNSLQDIVKKFGPMDIARAAHYVSQVAEGLQHAHEAAGLVHRDIKPGNILLDRSGTVKILDMGLARFLNEDAGALTKKYEKNAVLGTADYLAPEQAMDSSDVDQRADIYSLGATFYFLLTGRAPFDEGTVHEKLIWHQMKTPEPIRSLRPDVPKELEAVVNKMMAKKPVHRYQEPAAVVEALRPWTDRPIEPPADEEMPRHCPALDNYSASGVSLPAPGASGNLAGLRRVPRSGPRSASSHSRSSLPRPPAHAGRPRWLVPVVAGAALFAVGGLVTYAVAALLSKEPAGTTRLPARPAVAAAPHLETPPAPPVPPGAAGPVKPPPMSADNRMYVTSEPAAGRSDLHPTLGLALAAAKPGQTILVLEPAIEEQVLIDGRHCADVRVESGLGAGQRVAWRPPAGAAPDRPLLDLVAPTGLAFKGFDFDGGLRVATLIRARGEAPGLTLDGLSLTDAQSTSLALEDCAAPKDRPVVVRGVRFTAVRDYAAPAMLAPRANAGAVRPDAVRAKAAPAGLHLAVRDCRVEGLFQAGVRLEGPCDGEVRLSRFFTLRAEQRPKAAATCDAVAVAVPESGVVRLILASNTVARYSNLLRLDRVPRPDSGCTFELRSNLMIGGDAFVAAVPAADAAAAKPLFANSLGNVAHPGACDGGLKVFDKVEVSFGDIDANLASSHFLVYRKSGDTLPLYTAGAGGEPAGVPPRE